MRKIIMVASLLLLSSLLTAQENNRWIGIRGGITSGLEYRHFFNDHSSGKLLLGYRNRGLMLHGLYEIHRKDLSSSLSQISMVYGAGLHAGFQSWNETKQSGTYYVTRTVSGFAAGIDGLIALEYELQFIPLTAGLEMKPFLDFGGEHGIYIIPWDFAFTLKLRI